MGGGGGGGIITGPKEVFFFSGGFGGRRISRKDKENFLFTEVCGVGWGVEGGGRGKRRGKDILEGEERNFLLTKEGSCHLRTQKAFSSRSVDG